MRRKLLCILELENTILQTYSLHNSNTVFAGSERQRKPDFSKDGEGIKFRRGRDEFLDQIMKKSDKYFEVAVWSSSDKRLTEAASRAYFGPYFQK